jgi:hypothetical protein
METRNRACSALCFYRDRERRYRKKKRLTVLTHIEQQQRRRQRRGDNERSCLGWGQIHQRTLPLAAVSIAAHTIRGNLGGEA